MGYNEIEEVCELVSSNFEIRANDLGLRDEFLNQMREMLMQKIPC
jgi:hypothetical protein